MEGLKLNCLPADGPDRLLPTLFSLKQWPNISFKTNYWFEVQFILTFFLLLLILCKDRSWVKYYFTCLCTKTKDVEFSGGNIHHTDTSVWFMAASRIADFLILGTRDPHTTYTTHSMPRVSFSTNHLLFLNRPMALTDRSIPIRLGKECEIGLTKEKCWKQYLKLMLNPWPIYLFCNNPSQPTASFQLIRQVSGASAFQSQ